MSKCEETKEILVNWTYGAGMLDGLDRNHIEQCSECHSLLEEAEMMRPLLLDFSGKIGQEASQLLSDAKKRHSAALPLEATRTRRVTHWMKIAACLLVAVLSVVIYSTFQSNPPEFVYLAKMDSISSRNQIQSYVGKTQMLLMSLYSGDVKCGDEGEVVIVDRELAQKLIYQKRLLDPKLNTDEFQDFKPLLDQLELLLIDIASSDGCVRNEELELWRDVMNERSTLLKMNLLQMEGRI